MYSDCDGLKISTMVQIGKLNNNINLEKLFQNLELSDKIKYIQYGEHYKGKIDKLPKNSFFNQVIFIFFLFVYINHMPKCCCGLFLCTSSSVKNCLRSGL